MVTTAFGIAAALSRSSNERSVAGRVASGIGPVACDIAFIAAAAAESADGSSP
jgi:hypothetical protein